MELVEGEEGDASADAEGGREGAFENEGVAVELFSEFDRGATSDGAAPEDDLFFGVSALEGVFVKEVADFVAGFLGR